MATVAQLPPPGKARSSLVLRGASQELLKVATVAQLAVVASTQGAEEASRWSDGKEEQQGSIHNEDPTRAGRLRTNMAPEDSKDLPGEPPRAQTTENQVIFRRCLLAINASIKILECPPEASEGFKEAPQCPNSVAFFGSSHFSSGCLPARERAAALPARPRQPYSKPAPRCLRAAPRGTRRRRSGPMARGAAVAALLQLAVVCSVAVSIQTTGRQRGNMMTQGGPETWTVSIGGSGTTSMMHELSQVHPSLHVNSAGDGDGIKHRPFGLVGTSHLTNVKRIVYLHGDITHAILSLNRRGWLNVHARKVRSNGNVKDMTLEEYARTEGDDFFQVDMHFHSFRNQCEFDVAFLDITQKADHASELAAFLEVPESELQLHVRPWQFSMQMEEAILKQKDYSNFTEEEYVAELKNFEARNLEVANILEHIKEVPSWQSHYSDVPAWVIEALQAKFAGTTAELQQLGGLYIQKASCGES